MGYYFSFKPYIPVAKRREQALRKMEKLRKKGLIVQSIQINGRKIATTFWGETWCRHIESFKDYENRLPRGRTYVRNGSVCHLSIEQGLITGIVAGSDIYNVKITVASLLATTWDYIKKISLGKISSLLDLVSGKLTSGVMEVVCNGSKGIFPTLKEINLSCDCPDFANMCKHIAAVLYGVGARLDLHPEQLFKLRGVNHEDLIDLKTAINDITTTKTKHRLIADPKLSKIFDIELLGERIDNKPQSSSIGNKKLSGINSFTGIAVRNARKKLKLSYVAFAKKLGVSATTVSRWENKGREKLELKQSNVKALSKLLLSK